MFTYGFYNSLNGDRKYDATQISSIFDGIILDGVFANYGEMLATIPGTGMQVGVKTGRAWFKHTWNLNDTLLILAIDPADTLRPRIDSVVLEVNANTEVRANTIKIVKGNPATSPVPPTMIHDGLIDQYRLANVTVPAAAISIVANNIAITIGTDETPYVTSPLKAMSIQDLFQQWNGEFEEWFKNIKLALTDDVVSNLQYQIDERVKITDKAIASDYLNKTPNKWVDTEGLAVQTDMLWNTLSQALGGSAQITVTLKAANGKPIRNTEVVGVYATPDMTGWAKTDASGIAIGYFKLGTHQIGVAKTLDMNEKLITVTHEDPKPFEKIIDGITTNNFAKITTTTKNCRFSGNVKQLDLTIVGGGAGGGNMIEYNADLPLTAHAGGGGGGGVYVKENVSFTPHTDYTAVIGSGGTENSNGGASSFISLSATGGQTGSIAYAVTDIGPGGVSGTPTSGKGGNGSAANEQYNDTHTWLYVGYAGGYAGSVGIKGYSSFTDMVEYGSGGGGCGGYMGGGNGGGPNAGNGADTCTILFYNNSTSTWRPSTPSIRDGSSAVANTGCGGGGGGYARSGSVNSQTGTVTWKPPTLANGGSGGSGVITMRMHLHTEE